MIFGFNTDVKQGQTVYHVQSEARQTELLLQTQVFVGGRCIGKRATSYAAQFAQPDFSEEVMHEMLKAQHRAVLEAIRAGNLDAAFHVKTSVEDIGGAGLGLELLKATYFDSENVVLMRIKVTDGGIGASGARVNAHFDVNAGPLSEGTSQHDGTAELKLALQQTLTQPSSVVIRATHGEKSATRKFRLRKP